MSYDEIWTAIRQLKNNKASNTDGLAKDGGEMLVAGAGVWMQA